LDASVATHVIAPKPSLAAGRKVFTYSGEITGIPPGDAPSLLNTSYTLTADVEIPPDGAEGIAWSMAASACLTLAIIHLVIWLRQTDQRAHLLFSVTSSRWHRSPRVNCC
jgi:hypothetical protein